MILNILSEEDIDLVIEEIVNIKDFEKSDTEIEIYESIEELKFPQEYEDGCGIKLEDLNEKEMSDPRVQEMFKRCRHNSLSIFIISQDYHELPKRTIRVMERSTTYSNQTISETFKIPTKTKLPWI